MTHSEPTAMPIVGAFYRPPAKALLDALPVGTPLVLRPEPSNPFDPHAVMVVLRTENLVRALAQEGSRAEQHLQGELPGYGYTLEEVLAQDEWHVGYVPRTISRVLAEILDGGEAAAKLSYAADGAPQVQRLTNDAGANKA